MPNDVVKKASLFRETFSTMKASWRQWWLWVLVFGIFFAATQIILYQPVENDPLVKFFAQHPDLKANPSLIVGNPELKEQFRQAQHAHSAYDLSNTWRSLPLLLASFAAAYVFSVFQLKWVLPRSSVRHSFKGFLYWLVRRFWSLLRPSLWAIPLITALIMAGVFLKIIAPGIATAGYILLGCIGVFVFFWYMRSLVHYMAVTPLALLREGSELKQSWDLVDNNCWRAILNGIAVHIVTAILCVVAGAIPLLLIDKLLQNPLAFKDIFALFRGMQMAIATMAGSTYVCVVYRTLTAEKPTSSIE